METRNTISYKQQILARKHLGCEMHKVTDISIIDNMFPLSKVIMFVIYIQML